MSVPSSTFHESSLHKPIRDLGLQIEGTQLEPVLQQFQQELRDRGIQKLHPRFYPPLRSRSPFISRART
jgi:hypothetical protein